MTCLNFAGTGSRILLPPLSSSCRVIPSQKNHIEFQWGSKLSETIARRPWVWQGFKIEILRAVIFKASKKYVAKAPRQQSVEECCNTDNWQIHRTPLPNLTSIKYHSPCRHPRKYKCYWKSKAQSSDHGLSSSHLDHHVFYIYFNPTFVFKSFDSREPT